MVMKVFTEDLKGYMDTYRNVYKIKITKIDKKNVMILKFNSLKDDIIIYLKNIKLAYAVDNVNFEEYFRYEK